MKIRIETTPQVFARLCEALIDNDNLIHVRPVEVFGDDRYAKDATNGKFVKLIRENTENPHKVNVDLEVEENIRPGEVVYSLKGALWEKPVFRHRVDALFDILGIFPRAESSKEERLKKLILETYKLAIDLTHDVQVPGSLPAESTEWKISMGLGELRTGLEKVAQRFGFKPYYRK